MVYLNDDIAHFDLEAALPLLSEQRREQCLRFKHELGRKQCAAAYLLLCEALRKEYGITELPVFEFGEHGKPAIVDHSDIHFNLSHCREAVLCVVSDKPVGCDVESIGRYKETLARYTMNDEEMQQITNSERPDVAFIRLWTMKEAVLKRAGTGITDNMKTVLDGSLTDGQSVALQLTVEFSTIINIDKNYIYSITK